jgi:hypothetical protein
VTLKGRFSACWQAVTKRRAAAYRRWVKTTMNGIVAVLLIALATLAAAAVDASVAASPSDRSPRTRAAAIVKMWRAHLRAGARADPKPHFPSPSKATLASRLQLAARRYHFKVVSVRILHPRQAAPLVVVETKNKRALASSTPAILHLIDPKARTNDDRTGWAYEGFLFLARDSQRVPFLATFNWWRGPHAGGGQWASDPSLLPFSHGSSSAKRTTARRKAQHSGAG